MKKITLLCCFFTTLFLRNGAWGQINISTTTGSHSENFNSLVISGSETWIDNSTISNWYAQRTGTGSNIVANDGSNSAGNLYSYGTVSSSDRALGSVGSGNAAIGHLAWGVKLRNTTNSTLQIFLAYTGEQWRNSGAGSQTVSFYYKKSLTDFNALDPNNNLTWTNVSSLNFTSPITGGTAGALDGNNALNRTVFSTTAVTTLAPNEYIVLKWDDPDHTGADHGLSIDDVTISWSPLAPELQLEYPLGTPIVCGFNHNFGSIPATTNSDIVVRIANTGGDNLTINSFSGLSAPFSLVSPPTTPFNIPGGGHQDITIRFAPTTTGTFSSTLTINNNDADEGTCAINLSGTGITFTPSPELQLQIDPVTTNRACGYTLSYGTLQIAQTTDQIIRVRNVGTANLNITSAVLGGTNASEFSIISGPAPVVEPGEFTDIRVRHTPTSTGTKNATLIINNNDSDEGTCIVNLTSNINPGTYLEAGDVAILGFSTNRSSNNEDEIIIVFFKDITDQTTIDITDNAYMKCAVTDPATATNPVLGPLNPNSGGFGVTEGWIRLTYNGTTPFPKGRTVTVRISSTSVSIPAPASSGWSGVIFISGFNLNQVGEQIFFLQGGTPSNNSFTAACSQGGTYSGTNARFLYGFNTKGNYWVPSCQNADGNSSAAGCGVTGSGTIYSGTQNSAKPANFDCFLVWPTSQADYSAYTGPLTPASQREWINRISNPSNWTGYTQAGYEAYADPTFTNYDGPNQGRLLTINPGGYSAGIWIGDVNTDWFECRNWQNRRVPDQFTDVEINNNSVGDLEINSTSSLAPIAPTPYIADCRNFTIKSNANPSLKFRFPSSGTHTMRLYGDWKNELNTANFLEGNGTVEFRGNIDQQIVTNDLSSSGESYYEIIINKASGTNVVLASGNVTAQNIKFDSNSLVVLNDNNFIAGNIIGANASRYFQTKNSPASGGSLIQNVGTIGKLFPIGTNNYTPATIQFTSGNTDVKMRVFDGVFDHGTHGNAIANINEWVNKTWEITPTNPLESTITLQWNASDENPSFNRNNSEILKNRSTLTLLSSLGWESANGFANYNAALGSNPYTQTRSAITSYSKFGISSLIVLPLELLSLKGVVNYKGEAELAWQTSAERGILGFEVEKSADNQEFQRIGFVSAKNADFNKYHFVDKGFTGLSYYRLRVLESGSKIRYSNTISLDKAKSAQLLVYPNPATEKDAIKIAIGARELIANLIVEVFSQTGNLLSTFTEDLITIETRLSEKLQTLSKGLYIIRLQTENGQVFTTKFVKQ